MLFGLFLTLGVAVLSVALRSFQTCTGLAGLNVFIPAAASDLPTGSKYFVPCCLTSDLKSDIPSISPSPS